jgi:chemotaxis protein MotB
MARKKKHEEHVNHERWLVSYADFITLLFAFFVVMFAVSQVDTKKMGRFTESVQVATRWGLFEDSGSDQMAAVAAGTGQGMARTATQTPHTEARAEAEARRAQAEAAARAQAEATQASIQRELEGLLGEGQVELSQSDEGVIVRLREAAFFDSGSATLRSESHDALGEVAASLRQLPNDMRIEGHTDPLPIRTAAFRSNWDLSAARAASVLGYFTRHARIPERRLSVAGYAASRPLAPNDTAEGRRQNRRVDIVVLIRR